MVVFEARFFLDFFTNKREPHVYVMPNDYKGWVVIEYENTSCPALKKRRNF